MPESSSIPESSVSPASGSAGSEPPSPHAASTSEPAASIAAAAVKRLIFNVPPKESRGALPRGPLVLIKWFWAGVRRAGYEHKQDPAHICHQRRSALESVMG